MSLVLYVCDHTTLGAETRWSQRFTTVTVRLYVLYIYSYSPTDLYLSLYRRRSSASRGRAPSAAAAIRTSGLRPQAEGLKLGLGYLG